jgi:hypothetical protein
MDARMLTLAVLECTEALRQEQQIDRFFFYRNLVGNDLHVLQL